MKKDFINRETIEGRLYHHDLALKTVKNEQSANFGKEFISGTIDIATDEEGLNVIPVHFTYVTETTKNGKTNSTFTNLKNIINGAKTWETDGKDYALKLRVNTAIGLNDFYDAEGNLVSLKRNEGGFVSTTKDLNEKEDQRNTFDCDIVITSTTRVEADPERGIEKDFVRIKGGIFDFKNSLLPVEFVCKREDGMGYFESLDASTSEPIFTEVKGNIISSLIKKEIVEESAFGSASVKTVSRTVREWVVDWARPVEYDFGEADTITEEELKKVMADRQVYLAELKKNHDDYIASKNKETNKSSVENVMNVPKGDFDF